MSKNLILSAAIGYQFNQIEFFIKSLRKFYQDSVTFMIGEKDDEIEKELKKFGCDVVKIKVSKNEIQFKRYKTFLNYLQNKDFNNILLCDSRDIYFQSNPFEYNYKGQINFFLEDLSIKECSYNSNWILKTYGKNELKKISNKTILCSGTVLGQNKKIKEYLNLIIRNISDYKYKKKLKYFLTLRPDPEGRGCDQGHANFLVHNSKIEKFNLYSNSEGPIATVFYLNKINFNKKSFLINESGEPYLIVHQYDKRWDEFKNPISNFRSNLNI